MHCLFILLLLLCTLLNIFSSPNLKQIHVLFRHGERSPSSTYTNDPHKYYKWSGGWGQLTNRGKLQIYNLGLSLRKKYHDFLFDYYYPSDVKVISSYSERCLMSAEVLTSAMYPPVGDQVWNKDLRWQPIPVSYQKRESDNMIATKQPCMKYDKEFQELYKSPKMNKLNKKYSELYKYLEENTGDKFDNIGAVEILYSTLEIEEINNLTLPEWTKKVYPEEMKIVAALSLASFTDSDYMKKMKGGVFLKKLLTDMKNKVDNSKLPSVYLYSGHDLTIVHVLRTLNLTDLINPDFGAYITIELYQEGPNEIKVFYSNRAEDEATELYLQNCKSPCTLENFEKSLELLLPSDWNQECNF